MHVSIPLSRPDITQREIDAVMEVLHSEILSIGPQLERFERGCATVAGRRHGIGVSSGTAGLHVAMIAAGIQPGDEVITTPFSFVASGNAPLFVGAKPVFVDIDSRTLNIDLSRVEAAITARTRAIIGVEVFGHPGGMLELERLARRHEITLIEDSCEGFGGRIESGGGESRAIGSFGLASIFAFYPNKQITTGEGGMIVTDDDAFADACRALRNQGREGMGWLAHQRMGFNFRLDEMSAALGAAQLERLDEILESRRRVANHYMQRLMDNRYLVLPTLSDDHVMSWFVFVVRLNDLFAPGDRDTVMTRLRAEGIGCNNYFPPIHLQPYMREAFGFAPGAFPVCEFVGVRTLALPFFTRMTGRQVDRVCDVFERIIESTLTTPGAGRRFSDPV